MRIHSFTYVLILSAAVALAPATAKAQIPVPTLDLGAIANVGSKVSSLVTKVKDGIAKVQQFKEMTTQIGSGGFSFADLGSMAGQHLGQFMPKLPAELRGIQDKMEDPGAMSLETQKTMFKEEAEEMTVEAIEEINTARKVAKKTAIISGYAIAMKMREDAAGIGEITEELSQPPAQSSGGGEEGEDDEATIANINSNSRAMIEVYKQLTKVTKVTAAQLEVFATEKMED